MQFSTVFQASTEKSSLFFPDWEWIEKNTPVFAMRVLDQYAKNDGTLPIEKGFVYLINAVGSNYYKIGKSIDPSRRLLQIKPAMPFPCEFIKIWPSYFMSLGENYMHSQYSSERAHGEWFEFDEAEISLILTGQDLEHIRYAYCWQLFNLLECKLYTEKEGCEYQKIDDYINKINTGRHPYSHVPVETWVDAVGPMAWAENLFRSIALSSKSLRLN